MKIKFPDSFIRSRWSSSRRVDDTIESGPDFRKSRDAPVHSLSNPGRYVALTTTRDVRLATSEVFRVGGKRTVGKVDWP